MLNEIIFPEYNSQQAPVTPSAPSAATWVSNQSKKMTQSIEDIRHKVNITNRLPENLQMLVKREAVVHSRPDLESMYPFIHANLLTPKVNNYEINNLAQHVMIAGERNSARMRELFSNSRVITYVRGFGDTGDHLRLSLIMENDSQNNRHIITINDDSSWEARIGELAGRYSYDKHLEVHAHHQFNRDALILFDHVRRDRLLQNKELAIVIAGHSNGGAIANLLQLHLHTAGYSNVKAVTFGQPKVLSSLGAARYEKLPLIRVVNQEDPIPRLMSARISNLLLRAPRHIGQEILLTRSGRLSLVEFEQSEQKNITLAARGLPAERTGFHGMNNYMSTLNSMPSVTYGLPIEKSGGT